MRFYRTAVMSIALCGAIAPAARAQDAFDTPPPHIAFVDGDAALDREDISEPAVRDTPLVPGDRVRTTRGRVEVLFPDGSALDVDEYSSFELQAPALLRVTSGRVRLTVSGANDPSTAARFQIDTPTASAQTYGPGEYRVALLSGPSGIETELAVVRGSGALVTERGSMPLRAGERSIAWDNAAPSSPQFFNSGRFDAFDRWAVARRDERMGSTSAQYLPSDLRMYGGTLDRYGSWQYEAPYGYVWYPTVAPDWQPYYDGYWDSVPTYGWTWIGADYWSWPTHHYGRWGYGSRSRWYWIPDRRWAPAWVSWGGAPGYVTWSPLGFNNRSVFAFSISSGHSARGWTVLSRDHFGGRGRSVRQYAVSPRTLPANTPFVTHASSPVAPPRAVPRRVVGGGPAQPAATDRRALSVAGRPSPADAGRSTASDSPYATGRRQSPASGQAGATGRLPQAVGRRPQAGAAETVPPQNVQTPERPSDGRDRGAFRSPLPDRGRTPSPADSVIYMNRPYARPGAPPATTPQPSAPNAPAAPERPRYGTARPRFEPITPPAMPQGVPVQPSQGISPMPQRNPMGVPRYQQPQAPAPPAVASPPAAPAPAPAPREGRASASPREGGQQGQGRARGQESQPASSSSPPPESQGGSVGHGSRRPR